MSSFEQNKQEILDRITDCNNHDDLYIAIAAAKMFLKQHTSLPVIIATNKAEQHQFVEDVIEIANDEELS